ncbi:MAG: hypothetical protein ACFFCS_22510, partial [Candidatus Hodarchaeota archaeon]
LCNNRDSRQVSTGSSRRAPLKIVICRLFSFKNKESIMLLCTCYQLTLVCLPVIDHFPEEGIDQGIRVTTSTASKDPGASREVYFHSRKNKENYSLKDRGDGS